MAVHPLASYIGAFVMATFLNLFLFGVNWQQTLAYFEKLSVKERPVYVWTVIILWLLGAAHTATSIGTIYVTVVENFGNFEFLAYCPHYFAVDPILTALIALIAQIFYAHRVYVVSNRSIAVPILILFLTAFQLGWGIYCTVFAFLHPEWARISKIGWAVATWLFAMAAGDVVITSALVYYLSKAKTDFSATNSVIAKVIKHTITNNALTAVTATISAILFVTAPGVWHVLAGLIIGKFYAISLMSSLNHRAELANDLLATRGGANYATEIPGTHIPGTPKGSHDTGNSASSGFGATLRAVALKPRRPNHDRAAHSYSSYNETSSLPVQVTIESTSAEFTVEPTEAWEHHHDSKRHVPSRNHSVSDDFLTVKSEQPFQQ